MHSYQRDFIDFAIAHGVLRFGSFQLKSGRTSPYFFNAGLFQSGAALAKLGRFYADAAIQHGLSFDMLFGPAYKGIPLVAATAIALSAHYQKDLPWCFNRKETKNHGEGGILVGAPLQGRVLIVDDVMTAGTAIREVIPLLQQQDVKVAGVLIALNRQERGTSTLSAIEEVAQDFHIPVLSIIALTDLTGYLAEHPVLATHLPALEAYQARYGVHT